MNRKAVDFYQRLSYCILFRSDICANRFRRNDVVCRPMSRTLRVNQYHIILCTQQPYKENSISKKFKKLYSRSDDEVSFLKVRLRKSSKFSISRFYIQFLKIKSKISYIIFMILRLKRWCTVSLRNHETI